MKGKITIKENKIKTLWKGSLKQPLYNHEMIASPLLF